MTDERIVYLPETDSTNSEIRRRLVECPDMRGGTVVVADFQTAGRGQKGNSWESQSGKNLLFSILLRPRRMAAAHSFILSQLVSLSIVEVLGRYIPDVSIKWPNDIYYRDRKLVGILIENDMQGVDVALSIVGIGVNVRYIFCLRRPIRFLWRRYWGTKSIGICCSGSLSMPLLHRWRHTPLPTTRLSRLLI